MVPLIYPIYATGYLPMWCFRPPINGSLHLMTHIMGSHLLSTYPADPLYPSPPHYPWPLPLSLMAHPVTPWYLMVSRNGNPSGQDGMGDTPWHPMGYSLHLPIPYTPYATPHMAISRIQVSAYPHIGSFHYVMMSTSLMLHLMSTYSTDGTPLFSLLP